MYFDWARIGHEQEQLVAGKRTFATIRQLPSKRWQVRYTGPDGIRRTAPRTFETRITAEAFVVGGAPQDRP